MKADSMKAAPNLFFGCLPLRELGKGNPDQLAQSHSAGSWQHNLQE
jgi:hypothetical protein